MKQKIKNEINLLKENNDNTFSLALVFTCIILFTYCYFGSFSFFENIFKGIKNLNYWKIIYHNLMAFVLFFGLGVIFTKFIQKQKISNYGLNLKNYKFGSLICLIGIPIAIICALTTVLDKGMTNTYPLINFAIYNNFWEILLYFISYVLYYIGWEYLFRGILYFSSEKKCGASGAILITTLISALIHTSIGAFGKPMIETLSAIPAGLIFGYLAYKTRSIFPSFVLHVTVGLFTDLFIFII